MRLRVSGGGVWSSGEWRGSGGRRGCRRALARLAAALVPSFGEDVVERVKRRPARVLDGCVGEEALPVLKPPGLKAFVAEKAEVCPADVERRPVGIVATRNQRAHVAVEAPPLRATGGDLVAVELLLLAAVADAALSAEPLAGQQGAVTVGPADVERLVRLGSFSTCSNDGACARGKRRLRGLPAYGTRPGLVRPRGSLAHRRVVAVVAVIRSWDVAQTVTGGAVGAGPEAARRQGDARIG